jgi:hypothetical protein
MEITMGSKIIGLQAFPLAMALFLHISINMSNVPALLCFAVLF